MEAADVMWQRQTGAAERKRKEKFCLTYNIHPLTILSPVFF